MPKIPVHVDRIFFLGVMATLCTWCGLHGMLDVVIFGSLPALAFVVAWTLEEWR